MKEIEKIGIISNKSILKNTGKTWLMWIQILNKHGAINMTHKEIVKLLKTRYRQSLWWQQQVAISYDIYVGKRIEGQNSKGKYSATPVKTMPYSCSKVWRFIVSLKGQKIWLGEFADYSLDKGSSFEADGGYYGEVRTVLKNKRMRLKWIESETENKSYLNVHVISRGPNKCMLAFQHDQITSAKEKDKFKNHWKQVLEKISKALDA
jgi:hypothetical protein